MKKIHILLIFIFMIGLGSSSLFSQKKDTNGPSRSGKINKPILVPSIAQQIKDGTFIGVDPKMAPKDGPIKRRGANKFVPGKGLPLGDDPLIGNQMSANKHFGKEPLLVFDANEATATPSDPTGAVGPNHFIGAWNSSFRIFDKEGNPLTDLASLSTLFPGNNLGDPIVFYDAEADRFVITEFDNSPNGFNMAICQGPDPVNDGWYIYVTGFETGSFPDYTKFSVWSDGYYVTANINANEKVFVVDREEMLLGNESQFVSFPLPGITTSGFYSPQFFNVINDDLPPAGNASIVYMQDDSWEGVDNDHVKLWTVNVDWDNIDNSTISDAVEIETSPFISVFDGGSFSNVPQPQGPDQDVLQATIMNQAQFRQFDGYNSAIFNFVVDTDGSGGEMAGIRWFELRQDNHGDEWTVYQEGTYLSPYDDKHTFSGSMVMDGLGNIGMGYTTCSSEEYIAINYTGRYASDPLGQMTIDETLIGQSTTYNPSNRLADYVQISLDPTNDKTFWHIAEYFVNNKRTDVVGVFQIASDFGDDVGVSAIVSPISGSLSDQEVISVNVLNYGENTQTDIPVNYQINGGTIVSEIVAGPIETGEFVTYDFATTADLGNVGETYEITSFTSLDIDEFLENDTTTKSIYHMYPNDIGVIGIESPLSGSNLSDEEEITVSITNYGSMQQSNFDVSYKLNENVVSEVVEGPLNADETITYTFLETGDFMSFGEYFLSAYTSLDGDTDLFNDTTSTIITNSMCQPQADCSDGDGFYLFQLRDLINETGCSENGYADYTDMMVELEQDETYKFKATTNYGSQHINVWIDFNDNFVFETDEMIVDNLVIAQGQNSGVHTDSMWVNIPADANLGEHLMRAKSNWNFAVPDDACQETEYGETEDYKAHIILYTDIEQIPLANSEMIVKTLSNNKFEISLESSEVNEDLIINLHNVLGQKLVENRIKNINGRYVYDLDMSFAKPGAYIIRLGNNSYGKVKKIIVK